MSIKKNNKGFSLIELLVVIAIMTVAVALVGGSMSTVYSARSQKAAETLDAMIAQAKIDALSGLDCILVVGKSDDEYVAVLFERDESDNIVDYKEEEFGNNSLSFQAGPNEGSFTNLSNSGLFVMRFDLSNGSIVYAKTFAENIGSSMSAIGNNFTSFDNYFNDNGTSVFSSGKGYIKFSSIGSHTITLYKNTGEHQIDAN